MKIKHRNILRELMGACNEIGGSLDGTATNQRKYEDRQRAHMDVYKILYAVLADHPENEERESEWEAAEESLKKIKNLKNKVYPDKNGNF